MTVVSLVQHKGGVGKTTATLGLALVAREAGKRVLVVDLDPQRSAAHQIAEAELPLDVVCTWDRQRLPRGYDVIWVDTPGLQAATTGLALDLSDVVIVPLRASMLDWRGSQAVVEALALRGTRALWLPSQIDSRRANDRLLGDSLRDAMRGAKIPEWPVLPGIRSLASIAQLLGGDLKCSAADDFRSNYSKLKRYL